MFFVACSMWSSRLSMEMTCPVSPTIEASAMVSDPEPIPDSRTLFPGSIEQPIMMCPQSRGRMICAFRLMDSILSMSEGAKR